MISGPAPQIRKLKAQAPIICIKDIFLSPIPLSHTFGRNFSFGGNYLG
jgi:hypothetical protein